MSQEITEQPKDSRLGPQRKLSVDSLMTAALRPGLTQDKDLKACSDECPSRIFVSTDMAGLEGVPITDRDTMLEEEAVGRGCSVAL